MPSDNVSFALVQLTYGKLHNAIYCQKMIQSLFGINI